jgi:hypothetical protein
VQEVRVLRGFYDKELAHTRRALDETGQSYQFHMQPSTVSGSSGHSMIKS